MIHGQTSRIVSTRRGGGVYPLRALTPFRRGSRLRQGKHGVSALLRMIVPRFADKSTLFNGYVVNVTPIVKSARNRTAGAVTGVISHVGSGRSTPAKGCGLVLSGEHEAT